MLKLFGIGGLVLVLASCAISPGFSSRGMGFSDKNSFAVLQEKFVGTDQLVVNTDMVTAANKLLIKSGKLFVGDRVFPNGALTDTAFAWYVASLCTSLPQGEGISLRYELYDASGTIIQKSSAAVVATISAC